jgi:outer membrane protein OmpA-like peptidoglycan-associated protein
MGQLFATNWNGTQTRLLARGQSGEGLWFPVPAPDGTHFLAWLSRPDGTQDVVRVELNGRITPLTEIGERALPPMKNLRLGNAPVYSPDGSRIAYSFNGHLWLMDANGFNAETFISDGSSWAPAFSPDGKTLAYVNGQRGAYDLWLADLQSHDTWQLTDFGAFTVGHPRWTKDGKYIVLTRSQGDESDIVRVLASAETPLADADLLTKDKLSFNAVFNPDYTRILFTRIDEEERSRLVIAELDGSNPVLLDPLGAVSPAWMRPNTVTPSVFDATPSRPTPAPAQAAQAPTQAAQAPTQAAQAPTQAAQAPTQAAQAPTQAAQAPAQSAQAPAQAAQAPAQAAQAPTQAAQAPKRQTSVATQATPAAQPTAMPARSTAPQAGSGAVQPARVPTQPPLKAAPLRLRFKASFNADDSLEPSSLADLKTLGRRVSQYDSSQVQIIGPLDASPLRGRYPSAEARSRARAQAVAQALAKNNGLAANTIQVQPYAPVTVGASAPNSIQIYVELK